MGKRFLTLGTALATVFSKRFPPNSTIVSFCVTDVTAPGYEYTPSVTCATPFSTDP